MPGTNPQVMVTPAKLDEISAALEGYWGNDRWDITNPAFDEFRSLKWASNNNVIDFSNLQPGIRKEIKFFFSQRLQRHTLRLRTAFDDTDSVLFAWLIFLKRTYPNISSFMDIEINKAMAKWRSYLLEQGYQLIKMGRLSTNTYEGLLQQAYQFMADFYDDRDEFEKDVWDVRKIPGAKYTQNTCSYLLSSGISETQNDIHLWHRHPVFILEDEADPGITQPGDLRVNVVKA